MQHDYQSLVENAPVGIYTSTPQGRFLSMNAAGARMLGYASGQQLMAEVVDIGEQIFVNPGDRDKLLALLAKRGEVHEHECHLRRRDGRTFWAAVTVRAVQDASGEVALHQGFLTDISRRKRTERILSSRDQLRHLANSCTLSQLLQATLEQAEQLTSSQIGFYHFLEQDQTTIALQAWSRNTLAHNCVAPPSGLHYPVDQAGVWADCIRLRRPVMHNDYEALEHRKGFPPGHAPVHRELVVPVMRNNQILAMLGVGNKPVAYTEDDLEVVTSLADLAWDMAERKRSEETLLESERRFRRITEGLTDYLYTVHVQDDQVTRTTHSPACMAVTGYTAEEFARDPYLWINMVLPEDQAMVRRQAQDVLSTGHAASLEHRILRKDGALRWVSAVVIPKIDAQGRLVSYDGVVKDITERKEMEQALRKSEARVRTKLRSLLAPDGDIGDLALEDIVDIPALQRLMDDFYNLTNIGSAIVDLQGNVLVATGWQDICTKFHRVHPQTRANCIQSDTLLSSGGEPGTFKLYKCKNNLWDMATPIVVGDKHLGNLFLGQFLFDDETPDIELFRAQAREYGFDEQAYLQALGRVSRYSRNTVHQARAFYARLANLVSSLSFEQIRLARAMAEQTKAKEKLGELNARLERTVAERDKFFAIIAHDLRSPFIGFLSFIRLITEHIGNMSADDIRKLAQDMKGSAENLYNLLNNLLEWARIQRGSTPYEPQPHVLDEMVRNTLELIEPSARQKEIILDCVIPEDLAIMADRPMLSTVIRNLLFNAVKFTHRAGTITVTAQQDGSMIKVSVRDTGVGMDEGVLGDLFALDRKTCLQGTEGERGSGLGLLLCKEFIEKHGGRIWVQSSPGQGTTFSFTLPLAMHQLHAQAKNCAHPS